MVGHKKKTNGKTYGVSYLRLYVDDINNMFNAGIDVSSNKMSEGKMCERLQLLYPGRFSIPGETEIKQYIGTLSQQGKKKTDNPNKSNRGRKAGNTTVSWHPTLKEILDTNPTAKPKQIIEEFLKAFQTEAPNDLPMKDGSVDIDKIKSTISRFKTKIRKDAMKSVLE